MLYVLLQVGDGLITPLLSGSLCLGLVHALLRVTHGVRQRKGLIVIFRHFLATLRMRRRNARSPKFFSNYVGTYFVSGLTECSTWEMYQELRKFCMRIFSWALCLSLCTYAVPLGANSPSGGGFGANLNPPHLGAGGVLRVNDFGAGPRGV